METLNRALEDQRERVISDFVRQVTSDPHMEALRKISDCELQGLAGYIVTSLSDYLEGAEAEVTACFDFVGNTCFQLSIPLLETAYALYILRDELARVLTTEEASHETKERANKFFDRLVLELLRRY